MAFLKGLVYFCFFFFFFFFSLLLWRELFCAEGCVREDGEKPGAAFFIFCSKLKDGLPRALGDEKAMTKANL